MEDLEKSVMVQSLHIQQVKLEVDGGAYQPEERLEEIGDMSKEEAEQQLGDKTVGLESAVECQLNSTKGDKDRMVDQFDLPIDKEVQLRRLHKKS
jgi:hypothetical protein